MSGDESALRARIVRMLFYGVHSSKAGDAADAILALPELEALRRDAEIGRKLREIGQSTHWSAQGAINAALAAGDAKPPDGAE
jgi:hypothetical protein